MQIPSYPRIEQVFDDLLADIFEQYAGIHRRYLLVVRKECLAEDKLRVFIAFLRDPAKDTNFTYSDCQPIHAGIFVTNKILIAQRTLKILSVYKAVILRSYVKTLHASSIEVEVVLPTPPAHRTFKERVKFREIRASVMISGSMSTFVVTTLFLKRFIAGRLFRLSSSSGISEDRQFGDARDT